MYKISVPISTINVIRSDKEELLRQLKDLDAERVFLTLNPYGAIDRERRKRELSILKEYCVFLKRNGFEVGAWLWTFMLQGENDFTHMTAVTGSETENEACPSDEGYRAWMSEFLTEIARCGVDMIMFDDDFRYGAFQGGFGCLCRNHIKKISEILGETVTREFLTEKLLVGGSNKYRDAFMRANGYWLERFARQMRECIDRVDPDIRFGQCACMSSWDIDGTSPDRISRILAGGTKPFYRLIGAPYWAVRQPGRRLQDIIELERMESSWRRDKDIEIFCEGDVYPRPRWQIPAAFLEGFDTAMRAAACTDGILKYALDYTSGVRYERGYTDSHMRNKELYGKLEQYFAGKNACGVRVYEAPKKYAAQEIYERIEGDMKIQNIFYSPAAEMLACCAIPSVYEGGGVCGIAFGENARALPEQALNDGLILDMEAARILQLRGIDTGCERIGELLTPVEEYFVSENEYVAIFGETEKPTFRRAELRDGADVQSRFIVSNEELPASYFYENKSGQRFLVFTFEAYFNSEAMWRQYTRARQLTSAVKWLSSGKSLPAEASVTSPDLYMICKEKEGKLSVGLWNFSQDIVSEPEIKLNRRYGGITFINCSGSLAGDRVFLSDISPYAFAGFEVK